MDKNEYFRTWGSPVLQIYHQGAISVEQLAPIFNARESNELIKVEESIQSPKSEKFYTTEGCFDLVIRTKEFIIGTDREGHEHVFSLDKELTTDAAVNSVLFDLDYYSDVTLYNQIKEKGFKIVPIN